MAGSWSKVFRLSSRDYVHEWLMSGCFVLALATVLGPMMVLFGLKFGIVGAMVDQLIENPVIIFTSDFGRQIWPTLNRP